MDGLQHAATRFGACCRASTTPRCCRLWRGRPLGQIPPPHERETEWRREGMDLPGPVACHRRSVADYLRRRRRPVHISSRCMGVSPLEEATMEKDRGGARRRRRRPAPRSRPRAHPAVVFARAELPAAATAASSRPARSAWAATAATASSRRGGSAHAPCCRRILRPDASVARRRSVSWSGREKSHWRRRGLEREEWADWVVVHLRPYTRRPHCLPTTPILHTHEATHPAFHPQPLLDSGPYLSMVHLQAP
jgi:hypothetical protein